MTRDERAAENQSRFRDANEDIERAQRSYEFDGERVPFICECAEARCTAIIQLSVEEYGLARSGDDIFVVLPGHELEWELVRSRGDGYLIVEKPAPAAHGRQAAGP